MSNVNSVAIFSWLWATNSCKTWFCKTWFCNAI